MGSLNSEIRVYPSKVKRGLAVSSVLAELGAGSRGTQIENSCSGLRTSNLTTNALSLRC